MMILFKPNSNNITLKELYLSIFLIVALIFLKKTINNPQIPSNGQKSLDYEIIELCYLYFLNRITVWYLKI